MNIRPAYTIVSEQVRENCIADVRRLPIGWRVTLREPRRSDIQNDKMWAMLTDISKQVLWCGQRQTPDDWKDMLSAFLKKQRFVPAIDEDGEPGGGLVVLGARTREFKVAEMSDMIEALYWFGAQHGVIWSEPEPDRFAAPRIRGAKAERGGTVSAGSNAKAGGAVPSQISGGPSR